MRQFASGFLLPFCLALAIVGGAPLLARGAPPTDNPFLIADPTYGLPMPHLAPPTKKAIDAQPHWMWLGPVTGDQQCNARTVLTLPAAPRVAKIHVTGDDAYTLFVNGQQVAATEPVERGWSHARTISVSPYLHAGKNVIGVSGVNKGGGAAGILLALSVDGVPKLVSGSFWTAMLSPSPPDGWLSPAFDDSHWQNATDEGALGTGPWQNAVEDWPASNPEGWYMAHTVVRPVAVESLSGAGVVQNLKGLLQGGKSGDTVLSGGTASQPTQVLVDFGRELSGRLEVVGATSAKISVHTGESREACLRILTDKRLISIDNSGPWPLTLDENETQTTPYTAFRYALLTVQGVTPIALKRVDCDFKYYPVTYRGAFSCSDTLLTRIWYTGAYTTHQCMQEDIWDAPKRDRGLWIGDMHVSGETISNVFADRFLMEKTIAGGRAQIQGANPSPALPIADVNNIPGYTASWFGTLADFYRHDGDKAFLRSQHANILSLLAFQKTEFDAQNLFANPKKEWDFCDWAPGYVKDTPKTRATTHLFAIYGVRQAVFLLRALGDQKNAETYSLWADTLTEAAQTKLLDPQAKTYGNRVQENAMAIYAGVATADQRAAIYDTVLKSGAQAWTPPVGGSLSDSEVMSPFYGNYVLSAYGKLGQYQAGIDLVRRYWGAMLARGTTTWWECFDPSFPPDMNAVVSKMPYLSLCHGWSSGPTSFLTETILGVQPTAGGFDEVTIQPELCDLSWAEGTVPTPHGDIHLRVEKTASGVVCQLTLPAGIHASVHLGERTIPIDRGGTYRFTAPCLLRPDW